MFQVRAEIGSDKVPTLYILDAIGDDGEGGGTTVQRVQQFLNKYADAPNIKVMISSTGGDAYSGLAIYDQLFRFPGTVHTYGSGIVASAASVIFMAGSIRELSENCQFMIHEAWAEVTGRAREFRTAEMSLDQMNSLMANIYAQRSGQSLSLIKQWMGEETWFTGQEAKQFGFATIVSSAVTARASFNLSRFRNVPKSLQADASTDLNDWKRKLGKNVVEKAIEMARKQLNPKPKVTSEQKALIKAMEEQQKIRFQCECGKKLRTKAENEGKSVRCPACGELLVIRKQEEQTAPKSLADLVRLPRSAGRSGLQSASGKAPKSLADLVRVHS